ncbi:hypothetical protein ACTFIU_009056 [Dictyostelium citrinum]
MEGIKNLPSMVRLFRGKTRHQESLIHVLVDPHYRDFFHFVWKGVHYQWKTMSLGLSKAPRIFTMLDDGTVNQALFQVKSRKECPRTNSINHFPRVTNRLGIKRTGDVERRRVPLSITYFFPGIIFNKSHSIIIASILQDAVYSDNAIKHCPASVRIHCQSDCIKNTAGC